MTSLTLKDLAKISGAAETTIRDIHRDILKGGDEEYRQKIWDIVNRKLEK